MGEEGNGVGGEGKEKAGEDGGEGGRKRRGKR